MTRVLRSRKSKTQEGSWTCKWRNKILWKTLEMGRCLTTSCKWLGERRGWGLGIGLRKRPINCPISPCLGGSKRRVPFPFPQKLSKKCLAFYRTKWCQNDFLWSKKDTMWCQHRRRVSSMVRTKW
jgi:hypothetical protein